MELKEYIGIIKSNFKVFLWIIVLIVVGSFVYFSLKPVSYSTSLGINITRKGIQESAEYKYDDFYRLQADEKFAETIVEWLKSPRIVLDIYSKAEIDAKNLSLRKLSKILKPEKMSSQVVLVSFSAESPETAKKVSASIVKEISKNTENLNKDQQENTWFEIISSDPLIIKDFVSPLVLLIFSFLAGLFIAFWAVLIVHYLK